MLGRTSNQPGWLERCNVLVLARQTMQQFMWQPDMLQVAKFLDAGVKKMQEIDPDAGSNI